MWGVKYTAHVYWDMVGCSSAAAEHQTTVCISGSDAHKCAHKCAEVCRRSVYVRKCWLVINILKQTVVRLQSAPAAEYSTYIIIKLSHTWLRITTYLNVFVYITERGTCRRLSVCVAGWQVINSGLWSVDRESHKMWYTARDSDPI